jgi:hypothetical protein
MRERELIAYLDAVGCGNSDADRHHLAEEEVRSGEEGQAHSQEGGGPPQADLASEHESPGPAAGVDGRSGRPGTAASAGAAAPADHDPLFPASHDHREHASTGLLIAER